MAQRASWPAALWLRRHRMLGRSAFIWRIIVARFTVPVAAAATLLRAATESFSWGHFTGHMIANLMTAVLGGYVAGRILWALVVSR